MALNLLSQHMLVWLLLTFEGVGSVLEIDGVKKLHNTDKAIRTRVAALDPSLKLLVVRSQFR